MTSLRARLDNMLDGVADTRATSDNPARMTLTNLSTQDSTPVQQLAGALHSSRYTTGSTHNFYLYPARFSPEIARTVIELCSEPGDSVLDPFMGGGTSIIEGIMLSRRMFGVDLNALAHFVASVRTRPLSAADAAALRSWATRPGSDRSIVDVEVLNLPTSVRRFMARQMVAATGLRFLRQEAFARCALLRLGQWALDCRDASLPSRVRLTRKLPELVDEMLAGLEEFVAHCKIAGVSKRDISKNQTLYWGDAAEVARTETFGTRQQRVRLVFTSPPYPRVHVLYHRWQVRGRKETPAPYWIAQVPDGYYASHYTGGSRTPTGEQRYFSMIRDVYAAIRPRLAEDGVVVQLIGFADVETQLPLYLAAMNQAGFHEWSPPTGQRLWRTVPNRKWHAKLQTTGDATSELLLFHRPKRRGR